ncbi:MAG: phage integrase N-terminal SAM-like domain-containing protein [Candidatus Thiodiazotropha sp.]
MFNGKSHPNEMGKQEIEGYLNHLSSRRNVSASTQSGALTAIAFLYRTVYNRNYWQLVFPSTAVRPWLNTQQMARWHASPSTIRRAFKRAVQQAKIHKHVGGKLPECPL